MPESGLDTGSLFADAPGTMISRGVRLQVDSSQDRTARGGVRITAALAWLCVFWPTGVAGSSGTGGYLNSTTAADCVVTFNEVMYQPGQGGASLEWVELYNQLSVDVELSDWRLEGGVSYRFPTGTVLPAGAYLVVAANPAELRAVAGVEAAKGPFTGTLANEGERLILRNLNGRLMDELSYTDRPPWPVGADGSGASLAKVVAGSPSSPAHNWRASRELGGTPGGPNFPAPTASSQPVIDTLIGPVAQARWHVPRSGDGGTDWTAPGFDDAAWPPGTNGFGFDRSNATPTMRPDRFYPLETNVQDASGQGLHGTVQGSPRFDADTPSAVADSRASLRFGGEADTVTVSEPVVPGAYTLSLWVKLATVRSCSLLVLTSEPGPNTHWSHQLRVNASGQFEHYTFDGGLNLVSSRTIAQPGRWYHLAATAQNGGTAHLFVDGLEEGTPETIGSLWNAGDRWVMGSSSGHTPYSLHGWLDEVALWLEVVSPAQIAALASGASPMAAGGLAGLFASDLEAPMWGLSSSAWLRFPFARSAGVTHDQLLLHLRHNDGFVAWLNGVEVARRGAPSALEWNSAATAARTPAQSAVPETFDLTPHLGLVGTGANVLAVHGLNVAADDRDFLVQAELAGRRGTAAADGSGLVLSEVPAGGTTPFWGELANVGAAPVGLAGCVLRAAEGGETSLGTGVLGPGEIEVVRWPSAEPAPGIGDRLFLVGADGTQFIDAVRLEDAPQARARLDPDAPFSRPSHSTPGEANRFVVHDEIVINEILYHAPPACRQPGDPPEVATQTLLGWDATWRYEQSGSDLGTAWRSPAYDDSRWPMGQGILGYRTGVLAEPIRTPLTLGQWTYYFRVPFVLDHPADPTLLQLRVLVDDGGIFYLNGEEIYRQKMPAGSVNHTTPATNVGDPTVTGPQAILVSNLVSGTNWLAAEVHQWHLDSSDIVCGAELTINGAVTPGTPGTPFAENDQQWIELLNRSDQAVDLAGWRLGEAVDFEFPPDTRVGPGEFLVVARDAASLRREHPDLRVLGDFRRRLSHQADRVVLRDAAGNVADEVLYHDDRPWPAEADGGGSSLELRETRADNAAPSAWAASDESGRSVWQHYRYVARAVEPVYGPPLNGFSELRLGLLDDGECLLDNISVVEDPQGSRRSLLQNGGFAADASSWRLLGNHSHSRVEPDPDRPGNLVLHLVATDARGYLHNQIESTLKSGGAVAPVVAGREYEISFDAKWLRGSPQLHTELYYNRVARTVVLVQPAALGTPGAPNSTVVSNLGPTYTGLDHAPPVPRPGEPVTVSVTAQDPDGVDSLDLLYAIGDGAWQQIPMAPAADELVSEPDAPTCFGATLPAQSSSGSVIQFYVAGRDRRGAVSWWPAAGPESRALIRVDNRTPGPKRRSFHVVLAPRDGRQLDAFQNMMSDDRLGATVVWDNAEIYYDCGVHLHGSMFSRNNPDTATYNVQFPADRRFRGVHRTVQLKRRVIEEIIAKHVQNQSGVPGMYEDIVHLYSHRPGNAGAARMSLAHYNDVYLDSQYASGAEGPLLNMEGIRVAEATHDGSVEGVKLPFPIGWVADFDITDLGDDPEQYRWSFMIRNNRARDDATRVIALAKTFSLTGTSLQQAVPQVMDVDEWLRVFALLSLFGIGDSYTQGNPHNLNLYVRPTDHRVLAFPYDWDFMFALDPSASLWGNQNLSKIISLPVFKRRYHGTLLDLIETTFRADYLAAWVGHFGSVAGENYASVLDRVRARSQFVRAQLPAAIPFAVTTRSGAGILVTNLDVSLDGQGWIDVHEVFLAGQSTPLPVTWLDGTRWQVRLPLAAGTNHLTLEARNRRGELVGQDALTVVSTAPDDAPRRSLRITEIMYHPGPLTGPEVAAGFTDADQFEFLELANLSSEALALDGVRLDRGVAFDFSQATIRTLPGHARVVVARDGAAARFRYGEAVPIAGDYEGALDNGGEWLRLIDRYGYVIQEFAYGDDGEWPREADGLGRSIENLDPLGDPALAVHWQASGAVGGSPGRPALVPPVISSAAAGPDGVVLRFLAREGQSYRLLVSSEAVGGTWVLSTTVPPPPSDQLIEVSDPLPPRTDARFYRLVSP